MGKHLKIMALALVAGLWVLTGCGRQAAQTPDEVVVQLPTFCTQTVTGEGSQYFWYEYYNDELVLVSDYTLFATYIIVPRANDTQPLFQIRLHINSTDHELAEHEVEITVYSFMMYLTLPHAGKYYCKQRF